MSDDTQDTPPGAEQPPGSPEKTPRRRRGRWLKILLTVSLAFNLLFVGVAATLAFKHLTGRYHYGAGKLGHVMAETRSFIWHLPRERRQELKALARAHRDEFRDERELIEVAVRGLAETLGSDDFSEESLSVALVELEDRAGGLVRRGGDTLAELLLSLSDEERQELSQRMLSRLD